MVRVTWSISLVVAVLASPTQAATECATIAVSLKVEPTCAARTAPRRKPGAPPVVLACPTLPAPTTGEPPDNPAYVVRTVPGPEGTVVSFEF